MNIELARELMALDVVTWRTRMCGLFNGSPVTYLRCEGEKAIHHWYDDGGFFFMLGDDELHKVVINLDDGATAGILWGQLVLRCKEIDEANDYEDRFYPELTPGCVHIDYLDVNPFGADSDGEAIAKALIAVISIQASGSVLGRHSQPTES